LYCCRCLLGPAAITGGRVLAKWIELLEPRTVTLATILRGNLAKLILPQKAARDEEHAGHAGRTYSQFAGFALRYGSHSLYLSSPENERRVS
jgi:hypothetical protein